MTDIQTVIPRPGEVRPHKPYQTPDRRWEEVTEDMYGSTELPRSIHFEHDSLWNVRFWSVQNINDQSQFKRFGFWTVIWVLMTVSPLGWLYLMRHR